KTPHGEAEGGLTAPAESEVHFRSGIFTHNFGRNLSGRKSTRRVVEKETYMSEKAVINQSEEFSSQKNKPVKKAEKQKNNRRFTIMIITLPILLFVTIIVAVALGPVTIHPLTVWEIIISHLPFLDRFSSGEWTNADQNIVWEIRLPRVLLGVLVGAGLSLAGTGIQALVRNSLADPYILGVSSGASVGATLVILVGAFDLFGNYALSFAA